jgi:hypothetical protein
MKADPDESAIRFKVLLGDARYNVREWACFAGAKACGRKFVPALLEAWNDRARSVQECAMWARLDIDPSGRLLHALTLEMRKRLLTWDDDAAPGLARILTLLNDVEAIPYMSRYVKRSDLAKSDRERGEDYLLCLTEGLDAILHRIRNHDDHARMLTRAWLAFSTGTAEAEAAFEHLATTAPDERCRAIGDQARAALTTARANGPGPYFKGGLKFKDLPRL